MTQSTKELVTSTTTFQFKMLALSGQLKFSTETLPLNVYTVCDTEIVSTMAAFIK